MEHCCDSMNYHAFIDGDQDSRKSDKQVIVYFPYARKYGIKLDLSYTGWHIEIEYCPWCSMELPKKLGEEWCEAVKQDLGIEDVDAEEWAKLPEKYKTEQWWREKGL